MKCSACPQYSFQVRRCLLGKVNPKTRKGTKECMFLMGYNYICPENKWRNELFVELNNPTTKG